MKLLGLALVIFGGYGDKVKQDGDSGDAVATLVARWMIQLFNVNSEGLKQDFGYLIHTSHEC